MARCQHIGCGQEFKAHRREQRYCSYECKSRVRFARAAVKRFRLCQCCGMFFIAARPSGAQARGQAMWGMFCSNTCRAVYLKGDGIDGQRRKILTILGRRRECDVCAELHARVARTCGSAECQAQLNRQSAKQSAQRKHSREKGPRPCYECGASFVPVYGDKRRSFCSYECRKRTFRRQRRQKERARFRSAHVEPVDTTRVFERDGWRCGLCGRKTLKSKRGTYHSRAPELDHITPLSDGGEHSYRNTQCACRACNHAKSDGKGGQLRLLGDVGWGRLTS